ncbi:outer membrane protein assembly factor BamE [Bauldia litoralis]|uniref:Beta-barrel assembly machine subunit BamE n=1 Tax=Bauldia litoralis TaxID=665467 RepID=A0A1G6DAN5_9HYPH|nr:outer membrane protein assembly factor BamE [Bauldia litoralis]SDB42149.1 Beta-barrel assembly machine subunit BamE [Bauldia litoralis]
MSNGLRDISSPARRRLALAASLCLAVGIAGCAATEGIGTTSKHGYVVSDIAIEQVPVGSSKDQVLIALGSPSTTGNFGGESYYYISQTRKQPVAFMPERVVDQRVLAVYFNDDDEVTRIADYGLKDGQVFDFISRTTPTAGKDDNFVRQVIGGLLGG